MNVNAIIQAIQEAAGNDEIDDTTRRTTILDYGAYVGALTPLEQIRVHDALVAIGWTKTDAKGFVAASVKTVTGKSSSPVQFDLPESWPYDVDDGRICLLSKKIQDDGSVEISATPVADFTATITEVGVTEEGQQIYTVSGHAVRSGPFVVDIEAESFGDDRKLRGILDAAAGAKDPVRAGMARHLGPAIKLMTNGDLRHTRRYLRTGWQDGKFLIPGREDESTTVRLSRKLPYQIVDDRDFDKGMESIDALLNFVDPTIGTVVLSHLFVAPMAYLAGWRNERCGLFIAGRTGTQKSSVAQAAMCIYGPDFIRDENLIKWGEGATRNAVMAYATHTHDMPLLIDNYKPSTGGGTHDFTNLVHNIMEGGEKERLTRAASLRETKPVYTWPLFTGEDVPDNDPASIARVLVIHTMQGRNTAMLTTAQESIEHACAIGASWIDFLESPDGHAIVTETTRDLDKARRAWHAKIKALNPGTVNPMRVATNLAINELTWLVLMQHPTLGEWAAQYHAAHHAGLQTIVETMTGLTAQSLEANRFIDALREAIGGGRAIIIKDKGIAPENLTDPRETEKVIGWSDGANGIYLLPDVTLTLLKRAVGLDLGGLSKNTLYAQLDELGMVVSKGKDNRTAKVVWAGGRSQRVIHLRSVDIGE